MSGPIVRKYGFPNHEQIFGKRPLEHGAEPDARNAEKPPEAPPKAKADREKDKAREKP